MTITIARKKLNALKTSILADGRVDEVEVRELEAFIAPYVEAKVDMFLDFDHELQKVMADGKVDADESIELVGYIEKLSKRLFIEQTIEWLFFGSIVLLGLGYGAWMLFK